jgi:asparagine synthase (glutamine-hydrolysing)
MCGITGFWDFQKKRPRAELNHLAEKMAEAISYRGPDSHGTWADEQIGLAFGHRRLTILDPSPTGHQPMISSSGRYVITYNGEVYNCDEIKQELEYHSFRGTSDTEVILAAFEVWGVEKALPKLNGMFAFAVFDRQERQLYLVRDRLGIKPLYWGIQGQTLYFASELKCLKVHPDWEPHLNREALAHYLNYNYIPAPHSIFKDMHKLKPGCFLRIDQQLRPELTCYWEFGQVVQQGLLSHKNVKQSPHAYMEQLHELLRDSVKRHMISDVPLGAFLSGGVDSSTVVALMQSQSRMPIKTFSIGFLEKEFNEAEHARAVAEHLGCDHHELYLHVDQAADVIPELPDMYDEPFGDSSQIPTYLVSKLARQHVTVGLSGDGGDEVFAGYNRYLFTQGPWRKIKMVPRPLRNTLGLMIQSTSPEMWNQFAKLLPRKWQDKQFGYKLHKGASLISAADTFELYQNTVSFWGQPHDLVLETSQIGTPFPPTLPALDEVAYQQYIDTQYYLPDDILTKVDRASMAVSLEARVPLLDHRIVEFAWKMPTEMKIQQGNSKWPLRQILYQYVPQSKIERPKMGFGVPINRWLRGSLKDWAQDLIDPERLKADGILNPNMIDKRWREHLSGKRDWEHSLWGVLMFQAWKQRWLG